MAFLAQDTSLARMISSVSTAVAERNPLLHKRKKRKKTRRVIREAVLSMVWLVSLGGIVVSFGDVFFLMFKASRRLHYR